jgi:hypothetical protein
VRTPEQIGVLAQYRVLGRSRPAVAMFDMVKLDAVALEAAFHGEAG